MSLQLLIKNLFLEFVLVYRCLQILDMKKLKQKGLVGFQEKFQRLIIKIINSNFHTLVGTKLSIVKESKIFKDIENKSHMYFVHSYEFIPDDKSVVSATTDYSSNIVCSVEKENIFGTQFHPEKSDKLGLQIINNFINL